MPSAFPATAALVIGPASGGSFNPARSIAPAILSWDLSGLWIYILGPLLGGIIGGALFAVVRQRQLGLPVKSPQ